MEIKSLDHIIYGKSALAEEETMQVLGASGELNAEDAILWQRLIPLVPPVAENGQPGSAVGIVKGPEQTFILAKAAENFFDLSGTVYHFVLVPDAVFSGMHGNLQSLLAVLDEETPVRTPSNGVSIAPLPLPKIEAYSLNDRVALLESLLAKPEYGGMSGLLALLDIILAHSQILIRGLPPSDSQRVELIQGLMALVPQPARRALTFATSVNDVNTTRARIVFDDSGAETTRHIIDLTALPSTRSPLKLPYGHYLLEMWQGDLHALLALIDEMEIDASRLMVGHSIQTGLEIVVERHLLMRKLYNEESIPPASLIALLTSDIPPHDDVRLLAAERLLAYTFEERDPETARFVASLIDANDEIGKVLHEQVIAALDTEPDAVYFFVRTRLAEAVDPHWLPVLQAAAVISLQIAINDEEDETVMSWLNLIAREPATYELQSVLHAGILEAEKRIFRGSDLGNDLLLFTCRRAPGLIEELLDDDAFLASLQPPVGPAMRDYEPESVAATIGLTREMALVLMSRAAQNISKDERAAAVFTHDHIDYLWNLFTQQLVDDLPRDLQPDHIISLLILDGINNLPDDSIEALLTRIVISNQTEFFQQITRQVAEHDNLFPMLIDVFQKSSLPSDEIRTFITLMIDSEILTRKQAVDTALEIVTLRGWRGESLPLVEQITRLLQQNTELTVATSQLWQMLALAEQTRTEVVTRVMTRRLLTHMEMIEDDTELIDQMQHIQGLIQWNSNARTHFLQWWRGFVRAQSFVRLQRLDKALEGLRMLENARAVVQTSIAVHRMLGKRPLNDFATAVAEAFNVLQALSESFDPAGKQTLDFDAQTFRAELTARESDLSPDERSVLAKNLRELAQLITAMADNRSKSTLMRREEDIERSLLAGGQRPQSAIDTMKWLSGFLDGLQGRSSDDE